MKVLLVSEYFPPMVFGGGEISAYLLAKNLARSGIDVSVLTSAFEGLKESELKDKVKIYRKLKTGKNPGSVLENLKRSLVFSSSVKKEVRRIDKEENFDAIHFLNTTSIPTFKVNKKTVATINSYVPFCPKGNLFYKENEVCSGCSFTKFLGCIIRSEYFGKMKMGILMRYNPIFWIYSYFHYLRRRNSLENVGQFIAVSSFVKKHLAKEGFDSVVIPNLMELKKTGPKYKLNSKAAKGTIITYIGALEKIKGVEMLIKAFNKLKSKDATLLIVGSGSEEKNLKAIAGRNVMFLGKLDYKFIPSIYKQSDIIVLPSLWPEPLSRVLIEAAYFGKPVIATDVGGNVDGFVDGESGLLSSLNEGDLGDLMEKLINNKGLRSKLGRGQAKTFKNKFSKQATLTQYLLRLRNGS